MADRQPNKNKPKQFEYNIQTKSIDIEKNSLLSPKKFNLANNAHGV